MKEKVSEKHGYEKEDFHRRQYEALAPQKRIHGRAPSLHERHRLNPAERALWFITYGQSRDLRLIDDLQRGRYGSAPRLVHPRKPSEMYFDETGEELRVQGRS
jgi:hypothetical protein